MSSHCRACNRKFSDTQALDQHLRDSPVHTSPFKCKLCNKLFVNQDALEQHIRDSPKHRSTVRCDPCNKCFGDQEALDQHLRNSPAHAPTFKCGPCNRSFKSQDALEEHQRKARIHQQKINTPLDDFFRSYPGFNYNPSLPPATSFASLRKYQGWRKGESDSTKGWESYQHALQAELQMLYGAEDDLTAWHALCRAIGISPAPSTCARCEEAVRRTHVNIVDLIEWRRGDENRTVRTFKNVEALGNYTRATGKIFPKKITRQHSIVLRHLLRNLFS